VSLRQMSGLTRFSPAAAGKNQRRKTAGAQQQSAFSGQSRHNQSPPYVEGEREFKNRK